MGISPITIHCFIGEDSTTAVEIVPSQTPALPDKQPRNFVAAAVERVGDAVVRIDTERTTVAANNVQSPFFDDPFFHDFFGRDVFPQLLKEYNRVRVLDLLSIARGLFSLMPMW